MLVRVAEAERDRSAALDQAAKREERAKELEARVAELQRPRPPVEDPRVARLAGELEEARAQAARIEEALETTRGELKRSHQAAENAWSRAALAERSAADGAAAFALVRAEVEADRKRLVDLEAKLARVAREHAEELRALEEKRAQAATAAREELAVARRASARALEEERATAARAKQHARELEATLASTRATMTRAKQHLEDLERREEAAASHRTRSIAEALSALGPLGEGDPQAAPQPAAATAAEGESGSLDDIDIQLAD
jgi:hypothetical protein